MFNTLTVAGQIRKASISPWHLGVLSQNDHIRYFDFMLRHSRRSLHTFESNQLPGRTFSQPGKSSLGVKNFEAGLGSHGAQSFRFLTASAKPSPNYKPRDNKKENSPSAASAVPPQQWQIQKRALRKKFGEENWAPRKRLSPDALEGIRAIHAQNPEQFSTEVLAAKFEVSPEAIRRILKSKWRPTESEDEDRRQRWERRGESIWSKMAEIGVKPPKKWREKGITRKPDSGVRDAEDSSSTSTADAKPTDISDLADRPLSNRIL